MSGLHKGEKSIARDSCMLTPCLLAVPTRADRCRVMYFFTDYNSYISRSMQVRYAVLPYTPGQTVLVLFVNSSNRRSRRAERGHRPSYLISLTSRLSQRTRAKQALLLSDSARARMPCPVHLYSDKHVYLAARVVGAEGGREAPELEIDIIPCLGGYLASAPYR